MLPRLPELVTQEFKNEWRDIPESDYHKDLTAVARGDLLAFMKSGKSFLARRSREVEGEASEAMQFGRAAHMLALEPARFKETYVVMPDFGKMTSSINRQTKADWLAQLPAGIEAVSEEDLGRLTGICNALLMHPQARDIFEGGILEKCGYYRDPKTGLKMRIKPDCVDPSTNALYDFKTAREVSSRKFSASVWDHRYDLQLAMYSEGTGEILGIRPDMLGWVAVEKEPPFEVAVYVADEAMMQVGFETYRNALDRLADAVKKKDFGFYQKQVQTIGFPNYAFYSEEMTEWTTKMN